MARKRSTGGNIPSRPTKGGNPNARAVLTTRTGPNGRVKTLRALNPLQFITQQGGAKLPGSVTESPIAESKNIFIQRGRPPVRQRVGVTRLFRRDPYNLLSATAPPPFATGATVARFAPEAEQVDNLNTNPRFHPEKGSLGIRGVNIKRLPQAIFGSTAKRTHGNSVSYNKQQMTGGKTLRRR